MALDDSLMIIVIKLKLVIFCGFIIKITKIDVFMSFQRNACILNIDLYMYLNDQVHSSHSNIQTYEGIEKHNRI